MRVETDSNAAPDRSPLALGTPPFRFADPRQERIHGRLQLVGPGAAGFFRDACALMEAESWLVSTTHLVSHLLHEVESSLRAVLESVAPGARFEKRKGEDTHTAQIRAVLQGLEIPEDDITR